MMWILNLIILKNGINLFQKMLDQEKINLFIICLAENDEITYEAYVSEQNLLTDDSDEPIKHPLIEEIFSGKKGSQVILNNLIKKSFF